MDPTDTRSRCLPERHPRIGAVQDVLQQLQDYQATRIP